MRISFLLIIMAFLIYSFYVNWRSLSAASSKLILILLGIFNMILFAMYLFHVRLPFPAEWFYPKNT